jgi:HicA toxin of bacterial toxin-antitoxin,
VDRLHWSHGDATERSGDRESTLPHQKWRHPNGRQVIVAMHGNKPIPVGTFKSIIEGSGLSQDDFR